MRKKKIKIVIELLICLLIAWMITNGWAYILMGLGYLFSWSWAKGIGTTYLAFLWMPFTPEKLITLPLAIFLQHLLFPKDRVIARYLKLKLYQIKKKLKKKKRGD
jgi:hypothetical protein